MRRAERPPAPEVLARNGERWSLEEVAKSKTRSGAKKTRSRNLAARRKFDWRTHGGERVNKVILPDLKAMTAEHCAYCDGDGFGSFSLETIDHFLPRRAYPELSFIWDNLYLACPMCQNVKGREFDSAIDPDTYDDSLLRPDDADYSFERYFDFNVKTGEIKVAPGATPRDSERAAYTLRCFGLNEGNGPRVADRSSSASSEPARQSAPPSTTGPIASSSSCSCPAGATTTCRPRPEAGR